MCVCACMTVILYDNCMTVCVCVCVCVRTGIFVCVRV